MNTQGIEIIEINLIATGNRMITIYDQVTMVARENESPFFIVELVYDAACKYLSVK